MAFLATPNRTRLKPSINSADCSAKRNHRRPVQHLKSCTLHPERTSDFATRIFSEKLFKLFPAQKIAAARLYSGNAMCYRKAQQVRLTRVPTGESLDLPFASF